MYYYLSLQYSAIQKTILRHERLWSIAGISQILARINEIEFPNLVQKNGGLVMVAGGGKFTARFLNESEAESAKQELIKTIVSQLPMLEFQVSDIVEAENFKEAKTDKVDDNGKLIPGIIQELNEQKRTYRGYGLTHNPHIKVCEECQEYPATQEMYSVTENKKIDVCDVCYYAKKAADIKADNHLDAQTSIEKIYTEYFAYIGYKKIPLDFNDLFPPEPENNDSAKTDNEHSETGSDKLKKKRMAVWFSDLNSMNQKVPVWLNQDEDEIKNIFDKVTDVNIKIISESLKKTFPATMGPYANFRILVAGGDDLCIVMPDNFILEFAKNLSAQLYKTIDELEKVGDNPLSEKWLTEKRAELKEENDSKNNAGKEEGELKPYCFGASFIITSIHTPFKKIHTLGEELMSEAKEKTGRIGNSINWIVSDISFDDKPDKFISFEKSLLIEAPFENKKAFNEYLKKAFYYKKKLSNSYIQLIASRINEYDKDGDNLEKWLKQFAFSENKEVVDFILVDDFFRIDNKLHTPRLATLLEIVSIIKEEKE